MIRSLLAVGVALALGLLVVSVNPTAAQPGAGAAPAAQPAKNAEAELVQKVKDAIDKGVSYLKKNQSKDGDWEAFVLNVVGGQKGGPTGLATLALLTAGLTEKDPAVAKAVNWMRKLDADKTYVKALQTMVLAEARNKADLPQIQKNVEWFEEKVIRREGKLTGWSYPMNQVADNSNTQYAILGLYAAKTAGAKVSDQMWHDIKDYYTRTQRPDPDNAKAGYWTYHNAGDPDPSFTMSVSGACGLYIANMGLDTSEQGLDDRTGVAASCGIYKENEKLAKGMYWVGMQFNFIQGKSYYYNYYGIERLGRLSGQRFIGKFDWYREGCEKLVAAQELDGSFLAKAPGGRKQWIDTGWPIITTSFAVLFLSKGRTPVLVSKFAWGNFNKAVDEKEAHAVLVELDDNKNATTRPNWNRKHNDCRNMVEFASREIFDGVPLSWQVYDPRLLNLDAPADIDAEVGILLQSPVVYLNGHGAMPFVRRGRDVLGTHEKILQRYVEEGGFLMAEACCGDKDFAQSFEALLGRIFPGSTLRKVPPEHAVWTMFPGVTPADFPDLMYLDRGCRTVAFFSPSPLAGYWEERRFVPPEPRNPKTRGEKAFCLSRNIIAYATGMELPKPKLSTTKLTDSVDVGSARSKFRPAQLRYVSDTNVQPAPAADALKNLMQHLEQTAKLDVTRNSEVIGPAEQRLTRFKFMYLHGRKPVTFQQDELDNIKANLQTGGLLLADAACNDFKGWKAFDQSFRTAMKQMWGKDLEQIPERVNGKDEPLYKIAADAGINLRRVKCRRENAEGTGPQKEMQEYPALLEGIKIDGRWVVVYSKYDIGCAIEGHKSADCLGHDKESALRIASAVVLYSLKR